eukprot:9502234-Pyramimonas_sp.AAC.1
MRRAPDARAQRAEAAGPRPSNLKPKPQARQPPAPFKRSRPARARVKMARVGLGSTAPEPPLAHRAHLAL